MAKVNFIQGLNGDGPLHFHLSAPGVSRPITDFKPQEGSFTPLEWGYGNGRRHLPANSSSYPAI